MEKIAVALIKAQSQMGNASKDATNPFFKSKYADLNSIREACLPILNANGIAVIQPIVYDSGKSFVKTILLHESGQTIEGMTEVVCAKQNDPQAYGSALTYARRYGLQSIVNIGAEDDDANKAMQPAKPNHAKEYFELINNAHDAIISPKEKIDFLKNKQGVEYTKWSDSVLIAGIKGIKELIKNREDKLESLEFEKQSQTK
jgi:hypothetical protein